MEEKSRLDSVRKTFGLEYKRANRKCPMCDGEGEIFIQVLMGLPEAENLVKCPKCKGSGKVKVKENKEPTLPESLIPHLVEAAVLLSIAVTIESIYGIKSPTIINMYFGYILQGFNAR